MSMNSMKFRRSVVLELLAILVTLMGIVPPLAAFEPTPAQIQQFMALPEAQRQQLAREMGVTLPSGVPGSSTSTPVTDVAVVQPLGPSAITAETSTVVVSGNESPTLKAFGYDLFAGVATTFAPVTEIPIPADYRVGPGDVVRIQLFGKENRSHEVQIDRDGQLQIPELGPLSVSGLAFEDLRTLIGRTVKEKFIGVDSAVTLGALRSMRVFVLGESRTPGSYTVSSLSTITNALFVSGGVLETGSLRKIQLKRQGQLITELDLYDLLLRGDTRQDQRLQPGDVIFIPPVGSTVAIEGQVTRPAIYEIKGERTLGDLVTLAGGASPQANLSLTKVTRVSGGLQQKVLDIDLSIASGRNFAIQNGDQVLVPGVNGVAEGFVALEGSVTRPGQYAWRRGMRITDLIDSLRLDLKSDADLNYALLVREINAQRDIVTYAVDLARAVTQPGSEADLPLQELDRLIVFTRGQPRTAALAPVLTHLREQARPNQPQQTIIVEGEVRYPDTYPLSVNQTPENLLLAAGGLLDSAYMMNTEVSRYEQQPDGSVITRIVPLNLSELLDGRTNFRFESRDRLFIKRLPDYALRMVVEIEGEVRFPGRYTLTRGQTLKDLIDRAGGLTEVAFAEGAVFTRKRLAELEAERLRDAQQRLERDLATLQIEAAQDAKGASPEDVEQLQQLLQDVGSAKPLGRMVVNLPAVLQGDLQQNLVLQDGDRLRVPQISQSVSVIGEVQFATSHLFQESVTVSEYIARSGGPTTGADESRVYVVRADGSVWLPNQSGWFSASGEQLNPGDTIVVPLDADRLNKLQLWTNVSQIFYQIALGAAAVGSL